MIWAVFEHFKKRYQKANTISLIYNTLSVFFAQYLSKFSETYFEHPTLQGVLLIAIIPRAMPWARSFLGFQPASTDTKVPAKLFHFMALFLPMA